MLLEVLIHLLDHLLFERKPRAWVVRAYRASVGLCRRLAPFGRPRAVAAPTALEMALRHPSPWPQYMTDAGRRQMEALKRQRKLFALQPPHSGLYCTTGTAESISLWD